MDGYRFDAWTKALLGLGTRRTALRLLTGSAAGIAWFGRAEDAAACRKTGKKCKKHKQCCSKQCKGKKCRCKPLQASCPGETSSHVCCPQAGATPVCLYFNKPQCGPAEYRCLMHLDDPCATDCDCVFDLVCAGAPNPHCCAAPGRGCGDGSVTFDAICCSKQCGCNSPTGPCYCRNEGCKSSGGTCSGNVQCCDGICESGKCCLPQGIACTGTAQCCAGLFCDNDVCDTP
ncbi:MAG: hypothetical protein ACRDJC_17190 [Thermomicrobiales bacterium]